MDTNKQQHRRLIHHNSKRTRVQSACLCVGLSAHVSGAHEMYNVVSKDTLWFVNTMWNVDLSHGQTYKLYAPALRSDVHTMRARDEVMLCVCVRVCCASEKSESCVVKRIARLGPSHHRGGARNVDKSGFFARRWLWLWYELIWVLGLSSTRIFVGCETCSGIAVNVSKFNIPNNRQKCRSMKFK